MIRAFREIAVTEKSRPFSSAVERCKMSKYGYEEKEYYIDGTSNVYGMEDSGTKSILYADVPYINKMTIRCPKSPAKFNGHVVVEIVNATAHFDIERMWIVAHKYFMRSGTIYVGLTSKPDVFDSLLAYDAERYRELSWRNPRPQSEWKDPDPRLEISFVRKQDECGLVWDMLTDLAQALREDSPRNPLTAYPERKLTLTGWSQSASYMARYLNSFVYEGKGTRKQAYDSYLLAGGVWNLMIPLNQHEYGRHMDTAQLYVRHMEQPCIIVQTESENDHYGACDIPRWNSLISDKLCRLYEFAGSTHDTKYSLLDYYGNDADMNRIACLPKYKGVHAHPNDYPYEFLFRAAYRNLFVWMDLGIAPFTTERISTTGDHRNMKDAFGNTIGGVRTALIDYPTCRYYAWSQEKDGINGLFGHMQPFSASLLEELYGSLQNYRCLVEENTKLRVAEGILLQEDFDEFVELAVTSAAQRGLK